jgi:hypothetical protein
MKGTSLTVGITDPPFDRSAASLEATVVASGP